MDRFHVRYCLDFYAQKSDFLEAANRKILVPLIKKLACSVTYLYHIKLLIC